jgi:hypothetical protein
VNIEWSHSIHCVALIAHLLIHCSFPGQQHCRCTVPKFDTEQSDCLTGCPDGVRYSCKT